MLYIYIYIYICFLENQNIPSLRHDVGLSIWRDILEQNSKNKIGNYLICQGPGMGPKDPMGPGPIWPPVKLITYIWLILKNP